MERSEFKRLGRRQSEREARALAKDLEPGKRFCSACHAMSTPCPAQIALEENVVTWTQQLAGPPEMKDNDINTQKQLQ